MEVNQLNRYARQELINGWDQSKLTNARIAIIGCGELAKEIVLPLTALGIGNIRLIGIGEDTGFLDVKPKEQSCVASLEETLAKLNSDVSINGINAQLVNIAGTYLMQGVQCVIEATNDPKSKNIVHAYAGAYNIPYLSAACASNYGRILFNQSLGAMYEFDCREQDPLVSSVLGGLVAEEVKRIFMYDKDEFEEKKLIHPLYYNPLDKDRFVPITTALDKVMKEHSLYQDAKALIIGAGALGTFVGKLLGKMGFGLVDMIDPDIIEPTNVNRQILYCDSIGENKATTLAKKVAQISYGRTKTRGIVDYFTEKSSFKIKHDIIFDCVDSDMVRKVINAYANKNKIPLVSGGTDYQGGRCIVYVPGKTSCLCQVDIEKKAAAEEERRRNSCILAPNPSVIMTNQVIGGIMALEARTILSPDEYGEPINGVIKLTNHEYRVGVNHIKNICGCDENGS